MKLTGAQGVSFRIICRINSRVICHTWLSNQCPKGRQAGIVTNNSIKSATNNSAKSVPFNSETYIGRSIGGIEKPV